MYIIILVITIISMFPAYRIEYREDGSECIHFYFKYIRSEQVFVDNSFEKLCYLINTNE